VQERVPALIFTVRKRTYGLLQDGEATLLPWLQRYAPPGPVPGVPSWVLGLLNVHGAVQVIVDLGAFLGLGQSAREPETRLVFAERDGVTVGLLVDSAAGIRYLDPPAAVAAGHREPFVSRTAMLGGESVRVLDGKALIDALAHALEAPFVGRT